MALRWDQVDLVQGLVHITRRKHGVPSVHPLRGPELRSLYRLQRDWGDRSNDAVGEFINHGWPG